MNFIAINEAIGTNILSSYRNLLEIKTINKNKKKRSYQIIETFSFGF